MHPFVNSFNPAIAPPWQTRTDWDAFTTIAAAFSGLAAHPPGRAHATWSPRRCCTTRPDELATPHGRVRDWKAGDCEPVPGSRCPSSSRSSATTARSPTRWPRSARCWTPSAPTTKGVTFEVDKELEYLRHKNGTVRGGVADGRPVDRPRRAGVRGDPGAVRHHQRPPRHPGLPAPWRAAPARSSPTSPPSTRASRSPSPTPSPGRSPVITSPEWSGSESGGRRYSPFTINVERLKPWHTLTGRQHFFLDHDWIAELGEWLPVYRPPLNMHALFGEPRGRRRRASSASPCAT